MTESELQIQVADYLRLQYPEVLFHSDFGSGIKLTMGQAVKQKRLNGGHRAWPDMFIAKAKGGYHGLFIELKKNGTRLFRRDGFPASQHIAEQEQALIGLSDAGYRAMFAVGFEQAKEIIDNYLGGTR